MKFGTFLVVAAYIGSVHATSNSRFARTADGGTDLGAVHAPAPSPALVEVGTTTAGIHGRVTKKKCKKDKKEKKEDKTEKSKKKEKESKKTKSKEKEDPPSKSKKDEKDDCVEGRVHVKDSCESKEDAPVDVLEVKYDYTLQMEDEETLDSVVKEVEDTIHDTIVNEQMNCNNEGPVQNLRRLSISQTSRQLDGDEEHLRVVGVDPAPKDRPSDIDFCSPQAGENCISMHGFLTILLEGNVADKEQQKQEMEETAATTRNLIGKVMTNSPRTSLLQTPVLGSSRYDTNGNKSQENVESSSSIGAILAGVLAVSLIVAGAAFVYKKKQNGESILSGARSLGGGGESGGSSEVPVASAKLVRGQVDSSVPTATVIDADVNQSAPPTSDPAIDKSRLRRNFGTPAVAM